LTAPDRIVSSDERAQHQVGPTASKIGYVEIRQADSRTVYSTNHGVIIEPEGPLAQLNRSGARVFSSYRRNTRQAVVCDRAAPPYHE